MDVLLTGWLDWLSRSRGRTPATLSLYTRIMAEFFDQCVGERLAEAVTADDIEHFLQRPRGGRAKGGVAAAATQHRDASAIRGFYEWCVNSGTMTRNPAALVSTPPIRNVAPKPISDERWRLLWEATRLADRVALGLMFFGGLRREEVTRLRVSHVDVGNRRLVNFVRKGGGEGSLALGTMLSVFERKQPQLGAADFWPDLKRAVCEQGGDEFVLGWSDLGRPQKRPADARPLEPGQLDPQHMNHWLDRTCGSLHVEHTTPHQLRHSCATNLIRSGVPLPIVATLLNHSNVTTTMRYVRAGGDELGEWLART